MKRVAVIGAGPCGLPALKELLDAGHNAVLFERSGALGGIFAGAAAYPDLHLTISNWAMAFSDFPNPQRLSYSSAEEYLQYLKDYARHFNLERHIQYHSEVRSAQIGDNGLWDLEVLQVLEGSQTTSRLRVDALVVATGAHHVPNDRPVELADFDGRVLHSSDYNDAFKREVAEKKMRVMVVGGGESSADISSELAELSPNVTVWLRRPHCFGPRYLNKAREMDQVRANKTHDFPANSFLEAATTNRMSAAQNVYLYGLWRRILWRLPILNSALNRMCIESTAPAFFLNDQATFVTKNQRMCEAVEDKRIEVLVSRTISVNKGICEFHAERGCAIQRRNFDAVVLCTGYRPDFPWLKLEGFRANPRAWFLHCFPDGVGHSLSFVGYARPHQGGIPPMAEIQARYVAQILSGGRSLPLNYATLARNDEVAERKYYYLSPNLHTLVDYAAFLESVARRVGCEPQLPASCTIVFNLHMLSVVLIVLRHLAPSHLGNISLWYPLLLWVATTSGFVFLYDGLLVKWWLFPQWPVWYRQRGPGAKPIVLQTVLRRVPLWKSTAITPGFILLLLWSIPTFYIQRLLSLFLFLPHIALTALGLRFREAWGGLLRPKMVVLHSNIWRVSDLFLP
jgi:dimethylaniline monooxygenase (N-oxide forming)